MAYMISAGIVCVPERIEFATQMQKELSGQLGEEYVKLCVDTQHRGSWYGHKMATRAIHPLATHHLMLEDDVIFCKDFIPVLKKCIEAVPDEMLSLFATRVHLSKSKWAIKQGYNWYLDAYGASGLAVVMPAHFVKDFLEWEMKCPPAMPYEDSRYWGWCRDRSHYTWNPVPHLVEHGMPMNSSLGHIFNNVGKVAGDFLGDGDGMSIDWTAGVKELKADPRPKKYKWGEGTYMKWVGKHE